MNEPANHTAWIDQFGDAWVRCDEHPGANGGTWYPLDNFASEPQWARCYDGVGRARTWDRIDDELRVDLFTQASAEATSRAIESVRRAVVT